MMMIDPDQERKGIRLHYVKPLSYFFGYFSEELSLFKKKTGHAEKFRHKSNLIRKLKYFML
ncbi:hypothetical protein BK139_09995 [Paenibacillus sp. FSL R5-0490]|nr:hypothetical protein BK139_09995 [Paenibacillus sp. FSL R5-0490]